AQLDGLPADSYDEIRGQIGRLADQALPVCLTVATRGDREAGASADAPGATESASATESAAADGGQDRGTGSEPGVNCREVRRGPPPPPTPPPGRAAPGNWSCSCWPAPSRCWR